MEPSDDLSTYDQHNKSNLSETYEDYYSNAIDTKLFEKYYKNRSVSDTAFWTLVVSYSVLITVGTLGNLFVMSAVIRNNSMRTARNIFIALLAVADLTICLLTMPMTMVGVLAKYWPFGPSTWILCKIVRTSPPITVFFSSYTMAFIAIDRHRFIVHSAKRQVCGSEAVGISFGLFIISVLTSIPFIIFTKLKVMFKKPGEFDNIAFCVEDLPQFGQALMSVIVFIVHYFIPCIIVSICYKSVSRYQTHLPILVIGDSISRIMARRRRSNKMLIIVTVTHFLSWLPLNVVNIIFTTFDSDKTPLFSNIEHLFITYAVCHLASMTSAVSNPILYGFMNENFRREFKNIWLGLKKCVYCCKNDSNLSQPPEEIPIASTKKPWKKMSLDTLPATNV